MITATIEPIRSIWWDEYIGTAEELIAAGLVRDEELPGRPGNGKCMVTFTAEGLRAIKGNPKGSNGVAGYRKILKCSMHRYSVCRSVGQVEAERRREAYFEERRQREERMRSWPFPVCLGTPC